MIMQQQHSHEELCNLLVQSLIAKDEKSLLKVLEQEDEQIIKQIIERVPANYVRNLVIELRNILSNKLTVNHLKWLEQLLAQKYTLISSMADGRSVLLPLQSLLQDRSSPAYHTKLQSLRGKLTLLKQLKENRKSDRTETVVRLPVDREDSTHMDVESDTDTESEEELDDGEDGLKGSVNVDELNDEDSNRGESEEELESDNEH